MPAALVAVKTQSRTCRRNESFKLKPACVIKAEFRKVVPPDPWRVIEPVPERLPSTCQEPPPPVKKSIVRFVLFCQARFVIVPV